MERVEVLTAETERGQLAIEEVMSRSYAADIDGVPSGWARVRVVDDVPVSFIVVDPDRRMEFPGGDLRYAFICDVATREDRRGEGNFRGIMENTLSSLRADGIPLVVTHGRYQLYRRFGFDVFTHHCGIFVTPELIERALGTRVSEGTERLLVIDDGRYVREDLLLISDVKARTLPECKAALRASAAIARERKKVRIFFEHPPAPSYGSRYPIHPSLDTPFATLARACGAQIRIQGADPKGGSIPDADWIKVLDAKMFLREVLKFLGEPGDSPPKGAIGFDTDAGSAIIESSSEGVSVSSEVETSIPRVKWPSSALAQLVTGYRSAGVLSAIYDAPLPAESMAMLMALFPQRWRLSRNESWVFR